MNARFARKPKSRREFWSRRYRDGAVWSAGTIAIGPGGAGPMSLVQPEETAGDGVDGPGGGGEAGGDGVGCGGGGGCSAGGGGCGGGGCGGS